jgi:Ankyrin repeats (3 copies)
VRTKRGREELPVDPWVVVAFSIFGLPVLVPFLIMAAFALLGFWPKFEGPLTQAVWITWMMVSCVIALVIVLVRGDVFSHAIRLGSLSGVRKYVEKVAKVRTRNLLGSTRLHVAVDYGRLEIAELLLDHGANPNASDVLRRTPLHVARRSGRDDIARLLIERGASADARDWRGRTPGELVARQLKE